MIRMAGSFMGVAAAIVIIGSKVASADTQSIEGQAGFNVTELAPWLLYPNLTVISKLGFPARYKIKVDSDTSGLGEAVPLVGLRVSHGSRSGIEPAGEALIEGTDIGLLVNGSSIETALTGSYELEGLQPEVLQNNPWGGQLEVVDVLEDAIEIPQKLMIAQFTEPHFVRLCLRSFENPNDTSGPPPLVAYSVDDITVTRSVPDEKPNIASWHNGCVDLVGKKFTATPIRKINDPGKPPLPLPMPVRVFGAIAFAPLAIVQPTVDLANEVPPPLVGGIFTATWRTVHRKAVIAYNLPFDAKYAISYLETANDSTHSTLAVNREPGKEIIYMHEGGGVVVRSSEIQLTEAAPSGIGQTKLIGYSEADFKSLKFAISGELHSAPSSPQTVVALFKKPNFMRVCIDEANWLGPQLPKTNEATTPEVKLSLARSPHATLFMNGQLVLPSGFPIPLFKACTDLAAKSLEIGLFADQLVEQGVWQLKGTLYYRLLPSN